MKIIHIQADKIDSEVFVKTIGRIKGPMNISIKEGDWLDTMTLTEDAIAYVDWQQNSVIIRTSNRKVKYIADGLEVKRRVSR